MNNHDSGPETIGVSSIFSRGETIGVEAIGASSIFSREIELAPIPPLDTNSAPLGK
jgi:hypothetical protein